MRGIFVYNDIELESKIKSKAKSIDRNTQSQPKMTQTKLWYKNNIYENNKEIMKCKQSKSQKLNTNPNWENMMTIV